jgi:hypothetical protein
MSAEDRTFTVMFLISSHTTDRSGDKCQCTTLPIQGRGWLEDVLPEIKMTVTALAKHIGYSRVRLSNVLH